MLCKTNSLRTVEDIRIVNGDVDVHLVSYSDQSRIGVWFSRKVDTFSVILEYGLEDPRGLIGCLLPDLKSGAPKWSTKSIIWLSEDPRVVDGSVTHFVSTVSSAVYYNYQRWLLSTWMPENPHFSIYEDESTSRKFVEDTLQYMSANTVLKGLSLPFVKTYQLKAQETSLVSLNKEREIIMWFYTDLTTYNHYQELCYILSDVDLMYKYEPKLEGSNYWRYKGVTIEVILKKPEFEGYAADLEPGVSVVPLIMAAVKQTCGTVPDAPLAKCMDIPNQSNALIIVILLFLLIMAFVVVIIIIYYIDRPKAEIIVPAVPTT